jgi:hypothetical protein
MFKITQDSQGFDAYNITDEMDGELVGMIVPNQDVITHMDDEYIVILFQETYHFPNLAKATQYVLNEGNAALQEAINDIDDAMLRGAR